jgi:hypothetical protein
VTLRGLVVIAGLVLGTGCSADALTSGWSVPVGARPATDPKHIALYVSAPADRELDTVGYVAAQGNGTASAVLRLREEAARLGGDAVVDVKLRISHYKVETSGRAVRWR